MAFWLALFCAFVGTALTYPLTTYLTTKAELQDKTELAVLRAKNRELEKQTDATTDKNELVPEKAERPIIKTEVTDSPFVGCLVPGSPTTGQWGLYNITTDIIK